MRSAPRKTEIENAAANPGIWGLLGSGMAFFNDVLQTLKTHRVLALLWGICVLFLFFVVATFALAGELPPVGKLLLVGLALLFICGLFIFTVYWTEPRAALAVQPKSAGEALLDLTVNARASLRALDNAIRETIGPVTVFDRNWRDNQRENAIREMGKLADTEVILPTVRELIEKLEKEVRAHDRADQPPQISQEVRDAAGSVAACGRATLDALGDSEITPWPGRREFAKLVHAIRYSNDEKAETMVREEAQKVMGIVSRKSLADADRLIGRAGA